MSVHRTESSQGALARGELRVGVEQMMLQACAVRGLVEGVWWLGITINNGLGAHVSFKLETP